MIVGTEQPHAAHDPYDSRVYRWLRAVIDACLRHRLKVVGATVAIFVAG